MLITYSKIAILYVTSIAVSVIINLYITTAAANEIINQLVVMIAVHNSPLDESTSADPHQQRIILDNHLQYY